MILLENSVLDIKLKYFPLMKLKSSLHKYWKNWEKNFNMKQKFTKGKC